MIRLLTTCLFLSLSFIAAAQKKPVEKAPTQKEMQDMMKQAQELLNASMKEMSPEDKRMMDSMGIPMPDFNKAAKNIANVTDAQLKDAFEKENRIVPPKNAAKIAAIPAAVSNAGMGAYIVTVQNKTLPLLKADVKMTGEKIYAALRSRPAYEQGSAAAALWMMGKTQLAFYVMGKACAADAAQTDNLSNYAAMLSMLGAQQLALPVLQNLDARFPKNSTLLNNIGQAWFGLGDMAKAEKYIDSAIRIYAYHPQANFTKALIEESRGNTPAAIAAMKRSMVKAYSQQKEVKLNTLGYTATEKDFTIPGNKKNDPLNLGGFTPPAFPMSVSECITLGQQWNMYRQEIELTATAMLARKKELEKTAAATTQKRVDADIAMVKAAMANPGVRGSSSLTLIYATRAAKKLQPAKEKYDRKLSEFGKKYADFSTGEGAMLKNNYEKKMAELQEQDMEQTGEGKPNADFCPKYREASDAYLKAVNSKREALYKAFLQFEKEYINEVAYWSMYMQYPEMYEPLKISLQAQWLKDLANINSGIDFISITKYACKPAQDGKGSPLQKFDEVACKYQSSFWTPVGSIEMNCSQWTTNFEVGVLSVQLKQDMDRAEGDQFENCTVTLGPKIGKEVELGPVTIGAEAGAGVGVEIDRGGVKDVFVIAGAEAGANVGGPISVSAGVEGRISVVSGTGAVNGTGVFEGLK